MREHEIRTMTLFQVLGSPVRYQILKSLADGECTVADLAEQTGRESQNISQHLRILRVQNLVRFRTVRNQVLYRLKRREILSLLERANDFVRRKV